MMTIERQIEQMALDFPHWAVEHCGSDTAVWTGTLTPNRTTYQIRIEHTVPVVLEMRSLLLMQPLVEVVSPKLKELEGNPEGPLPHVYWKHPRTKRSGPFLCLFDADAREWTLSDALSRTTVPWTAFWLDYYEAWLATGKWLGKGRHAGGGTANGKKPSRQQSELLELFSTAAFLGNTL
jgi:hypothetical protein